MKLLDLDDNKIIELYKTKFCHEIGDMFGVSSNTIYRRLKENNVRIIRSGWTLSEKAKENMSNCKKGHLVLEETRQKLKEINIGNKASKETKQKMKTTAKRNGRRPPIMKGQNNPNWKGGITSISHSIRTNYIYRQWRDDVFTRDNFTCKECGHRGGYLHAHHITPFSSIIQFYEITTLEEALNCAELWNINNGITLCKECHKKLHKKVKI